MIEGLLLGLSTGTYCAMTCAPLALPTLLAEPGTHKSNAIRVSLFMLVRLLAYIGVGFGLGLAGAYAKTYLDPLTARVLQLVSWTLAGGVLTAGGLVYNAPKLRFCLVASRLWKPERSSLVLGVMAGMSVCPPFFAAAARVFSLDAGRATGSAPATGSGLSGALYFLMFFLGTSVYLLPLFGIGFLGAARGEQAARVRHRIAVVARATMLLLGVYFLLFEGLFGLAKL